MLSGSVWELDYLRCFDLVGAYILQEILLLIPETSYPISKLTLCRRRQNENTR
jgi:hypothetical protein